LIEIEQHLLLQRSVTRRKLKSGSGDRAFTKQVVPGCVQPKVEDVPRGDNKLLAAGKLVDDLVAAKVIKDAAILGHMGSGHRRPHQVQLDNLEAVIAQCEGVGIALNQKRANRIQQEIADRLVRVRKTDKARKGGCGNAGSPRTFRPLPVRTGAHRDRLRIGRDARFDHSVAAARLNVLAQLPEVPRAAGRQPPARIRQVIRALSVLPLGFKSESRKGPAY
jgi:hypothetical protein